MRAAVVEAFKEPVKIWSDWKDPEVGPNDVLMKVMANAVCRSDWHLWQGHWDWMGFVPELPAVLGHECSGIVEEVGSEVTQFGKGDRVVVPFGHACGSCGSCAVGHQHLCENLSIPVFTTGGAFADYTLVTHGDVNLVKLPESISFVDGASLGCRFMTAFRAVAYQAGVQAGDWVAVFGCGGVGLAAVNIASALGANVIAVSRGQAKLDKAKEMGAVHTIQASERSAEEIQEFTQGGVHSAVECLGTSATFTPSLLSLRAGGRMVRVGMSGAEDGGVMELLADVVTARELTIVGSFGMQARCYPEMLRMIESGKLQPAKLVGQEVQLEQLNDVFDSMGRFDTLGYSVVTMG